MTEPAPTAIGPAARVSDDALGGLLARAVAGRVGPGGPLLQRRDVIVQGSYMTGDMFGIAAALALSDFGVLILKEDAHGAREEQSALIKAFYESTLRESGVSDPEIARRIKLLEVGDAQAEFKGLTAKVNPRGAQWPTHLANLNKYKRLAGFAGSDRFQSPGHATWKVGDEFQKNPGAALAKVRKAWATRVVGPTENKLEEYLTNKGIVKGNKYALLWVRLSAKRKAGGAHPELDTSVEGVRNLKTALKDAGRESIIIGDRPNKADVLDDAIDMIEFWKDEAFTGLTLLQGRLAQLRMFDHMVRNGYDVVSIGMRSGAMEGPALLGIPTVYIEEEDNLQHERMEKWISKIPGWNQARVGALPTRTGRRTQRGATSFPQLNKRLTNAIDAVGQELDYEYEDTRKLLIAAFDSTKATFYENVGDAIKTPVWPRLRTKLGTWHDAYTVLWASAEPLNTYEDEIAALTKLDAEEVGDRLWALRDTATNVHKGLADFVREAVASLETVHSKQLAAALGKWRSQFTGKVSLKKGFDPADVTKILAAVGNSVKEARFARVK